MTFRCNKCNSQITLDHSLQHISRAQAKLLVSKVPKAQPRAPPLPHQFIPSDRLQKYKNIVDAADSKPAYFESHAELENDDEASLNQSFVYISDSEETESASNKVHNEMDTQSTSVDEQLPDFSKIKTLNQIFDILLVNQDVAHPMCSECCDLLSENYKLKFDQSQREKEYYMAFLRKLKERETDFMRTGTPLDEEMSSSTIRLKQLHLSEHEKLEQLEALETRNQQLKAQLEGLNEHLETTSRTQLDDLYQMKNTLTLNLQEKQNKLDQTKALYNKQLHQLDELRKFNVFKKLYDILFQGDCGMINGFRLGYRIPWSECNVALGQIVQMLQFLKKRLDITLEHYRLVPLGSKSYIVKQPAPSSEPTQKPKTNSVLQLHSSNEFTLGKLFNFNKLDVSMIALLDIMTQFESQLQTRDSELTLPYRALIKEGTLGGKSIRVTSNGHWTESCRFLLVNLNWILSYASAQHED